MAYVPPLAKQPVHYNVGQWIEENEKYFLPPVCNKMMHNTQLKVGCFNRPIRKCSLFNLLFHILFPNVYT